MVDGATPTTYMSLAGALYQVQSMAGVKRWSALRFKIATFELGLGRHSTEELSI